MGHEYSYVVVKLEFCNSGPVCGCGCGCGPTCGRVKTHEAQVLGRYTIDLSSCTTGMVCGVGAVDDKYSPAIKIPRCYPSMCSPTVTRDDEKTLLGPHFNPGTLPVHNVAASHPFTIECFGRGAQFLASLHELTAGLWPHSPRPSPWLAGQPGALPRNTGNRSRLKERQLIDREKRFP